MSDDERPYVIPFPDEFRVRTWETSHGWFCTLSGRPRNDAPYWHGHGASPGEAFQDAYSSALHGFEGEGVRVEPIGDEP